MLTIRNVNWWMATLIGVLVALPMPALAQVPSIDRLCMYVASKSKVQDKDSPFTYNYQAIIYNAAGVSAEEYETGSEQEIARKVRIVWDRDIAPQRCGPMAVPATGDPLKYAIHTAFNEFITEAISFWQVDLNRIDENGTYLDFLDYRIARSNGIIKRDLEIYKRSFIEMGAVRAIDLQGR